MNQEKSKSNYVVCLNNDGYLASLEKGKIYKTLKDKEAESEGWLRVIDEDGEDYLYNKERFEYIELPNSLKRKLNKVYA